MPNQLFPSEIHLEDLSTDTLNRTEFADKVLNNILIKMELPNTIGIYGNWGSGKTTFLHFLKKKIQENSTLRERIHILHFQPWKYEYSDSTDLLFALLKELEKEFNLKRTVDWKKLAALVVGSAGYTLEVAIKAATKNAVSLTKGKDFIEQIEKDLKSTSYLKYSKWIDEFNEISNLFSNFIKKGLTKLNKEKVFIFIDDLDRCLPGRTIHLLESIKNFLYQSDTLFIFALDHRVVSEMIEKKYGLHKGYGDEYLEKIINYHVELPSATLENIFRNCLQLHQININEYSISQILHFIDSLYKEPRKAKRIINQFVMLKYLGNTPNVPVNGQQIYYTFLALYLKQNFKIHFSNKSEINFKVDLINNLFRYKSNTSTYQNYRLRDATFTEEELSRIYTAIEIFNSGLTPPEQFAPELLQAVFELYL